MDVSSLRARLSAAVEAEDASAAWAVLEPHEHAVGRDPEVAALWADLLRLTPDRPTLRDEAARLLDAFPGDPVVVGLGVGALIAAAERRPMDEPPLSDEGPAHLAARAAARCIADLPANAKNDPAVAGHLHRLLGNALRLCGPGRDADALAAFEHAITLDRDDGGLWYDLALLHKWRGRFQQGYECNLKAQARLGDSRGLLWNLGICATAVGDGNVAGLCWKKLGFPVELNPKSGHPFVDGLPPMQVRVLSRSSGYGMGGSLPEGAVGFEVVWVQPLSPCHGVVVTPTFRDAPIDYGDVVLWDGSPVAVHTTADGTKVPRFPLLEILRRGDERRFRFVGLQQRSGDTEALAESLPEGTVVYVHEERVEHLCPTCASGDSMKKHDHLPPEEHRLVYGKIVVPGSVDLHAFQHALEDAIRKGGRVTLAVPGLYEALGDSKRAGQEHQAFRGIERSAIKKGLVGPSA